jgi:hypothetical protein
MSPRTPHRLRWLLHLVAAAALALVTSWYLAPDFIVDLGVRLWSCF